MLDEHELGLHGRDFPGELFVLGDELLEEGDDAFDVMLCIQVSENVVRAADPRDDGTRTSESADDPRAGKGGGPKACGFKREYSLASAWAESVWTVYSTS